MEDRIVVDYKVITRNVSTGFWGEVLADQSHFERAAKELIDRGYLPTSELQTTSGSAGGFFASSQYPTLSQSFVLYGTAEEKAAFDKMEAERIEKERQQRLADEERSLKADRSLVLFVLGMFLFVWLMSKLV